MNGQELEKDDLLKEEIDDESPEGIKFTDNRRFNDAGEKIQVDIRDREKKKPKDPPRSPETVRLEQALKEVTLRCNAAESKLIDVQKRFEMERANLEDETAKIRERLKKSLEQRAEQGRFNFLITLLPLLDNLNLAIEASEKDSSFEHLLGGVKGTARSFKQALLNVGVESVRTIGEKFDPEIHEAVDVTETDAEHDGMITAEYSAGYTYHGKLLRPARVQVGRSADSGSAAE